MEFDRDEMGSFPGLLPHHGIEDIEEVLGDAFAGSIADQAELEQTGIGQSLQLGKSGIVGGRHGGMVQMFVYPVGQIVQFTEIDNEAMLVRLVGPKG